MVMESKTMEDILKLTQAWHAQLSHHLQENADNASSERNKMLLDYLSDHEARLSDILQTFREKADLRALDTWLYEYTDRHKIIHQDPREVPFNQMSDKEISGKIAELHQGLVDLYTHLYSRAESHSARDTLGQLLDIQKNKSKIISAGSERSGEF